jgi:hypothetical protein
VFQKPDAAPAAELRRQQAIANGPCYQEENAAVGEMDCTPMLKLVPFGSQTDARQKMETDV